MKSILRYINTCLIFLTPLLWKGAGGEVFAQPQNLVPNHSFEDLINGCPPNTQAPNSTFLTTYVKDWFSLSFGMSPDYCHRCNGSNSFGYGIPENVHGYQNPKTGDAYILIHPWSNGGWEYIESKLLQPLVSNRIYYLEFYVSIVDRSSIAIHNIGAYFSQNMLWCNCNRITNIIPQIENTRQIQPLTDRENWMKISGTFIAQGGEEYLTIGNFRDTGSLELDTVPPSPPYTFHPSITFYYIDDVFLYDYEEWQAWQDSLNNNIPEPMPLKLPDAFSPNGDGINDFFVIDGIEGYPHNELYIYNRWGELVYYKQAYDNTFSGYSNTSLGPSSRRDAQRTKPLVEGTYFYVFRTGKDNESYSGFLELRR